jgi:DNA polymerase (family 10)
MTELQKAFIQHLSEIEFFLSYRDANPFKIRAYKKAQESLSELASEDFQPLWEGGRLHELAGIGKGLSQVADEFKRTQTSSEWKESRGDLPLSLLNFLEIRGLGIKKIKSLYENLQIKSIGELEYACQENRLVDLSGFGEKTQSKILKEIQIWKQGQEYFLLSEASELSEEIEKKFKSKKWTAVGDWGAKRPVLQSVDFLFVEEKKKKSLNLSFLKEYKPSLSTESSAPFRSSIFSHRSGRKIRFWFCDETEFPTASIFLTSHPDHWKMLQEAAQKRKLLLEPGALRSETSALNMTSDREVYESLGLSYSPPEARELSMQNPHPLVKSESIQGVFHAHSTYSDGKNELEEMAEACQKAGWRYFGISEHSQTAVYARGLDQSRLEDQWKRIDQWNKEHPELRILKGIESDILKNGELDYPESLLKNFDFVIASIHQRYGKMEMTERLVKAIQNPFTSMLGHLSGRLLLSRDAYQFDKEKVFREAIQNKVIIELNASPYRLDLDWRDCFEACREGLLISINPDAHSVDGLKDLQYGLWMARKALVPEEQIFNTWSLERVEDFLKQRTA